jgi:hypothetical protein
MAFSAVTASVAPRPLALVLLRLRDRWEDVARSLIQLVLGTAMVRHARRVRSVPAVSKGVR